MRCVVSLKRVFDTRGPHPPTHGDLFLRIFESLSILIRVTVPHQPCANVQYFVAIAKSRILQYNSSIILRHRIALFSHLMGQIGLRGYFSKQRRSQYTAAQYTAAQYTATQYTAAQYTVLAGKGDPQLGSDGRDPGDDGDEGGDRI